MRPQLVCGVKTKDSMHNMFSTHHITIENEIHSCHVLGPVPKSNFARVIIVMKYLEKSVKQKQTVKSARKLLRVQPLYIETGLK